MNEAAVCIWCGDPLPVLEAQAFVNARCHACRAADQVTAERDHFLRLLAISAGAGAVRSWG